MRQVKIKEIFTKINLTYLITGIIILCGIILRLKVYFYNSSFWLDECALGANILERPYLKLFSPLSIGQVAPPFFMIVCKFILDISQQVHNFEIRDMMLRLFPCICSIVSLPLFSYIVHKMFNNRYFTWFCTAMLAFNDTAINYAQEFKQYSCEMMFSIILAIAFYSTDIKTVSYKKLWLCNLLFMLSIWFSAGAFIILAAGYLILLIDMIKNKYWDKTKILILTLPMISNLFLFYFLYYRRVFKVHHEGMYNFWAVRVPSFFNFENFADLFVAKMQNLIAFPYTKYFLLFMIINIIILLTCRRQWNKYYVLIPLLLCITASFLQIYPFEQRLILYLLPFFIILYSQIILLLKNTKLTTLILIIAMIFISVKITSRKPERFIFHKEYYREIGQTLKIHNPQNKNIFYTTPQSSYYIKIKDSEFYREFLWDNFNKSKLPEKLKTAPNGDYWIECSLEKKTIDYNKKLKEFLYNDPHLKVVQIWTIPENENIYLIHFKKIKDYN